MIPSVPPEKPTGRPGPLARIKSSTGLAVAALVGITLTFYYKLWLPGLVLIKRDAFAFHLVIKQYLVERLSAGELPQWFPYESLGRPFIGATHTGVFHPFTALYFLLSIPDAYRVSTLLSCLLAAVGAFTLGRTLNFSRAGALVAGVAFALSGYVVSLTDHITYLYSICVLPLFCLALEKAFTGVRSWMVAPAVVWATVFLNGDVQTGYYYIFIAVAWALARATGSRLEAVRRLALAGVLAALLAGIQLGPAWVVFTGSERAHPNQFLESALQWSTHPLRLVSILASPIGEQLDPVLLASIFFKTPHAGFVAESLYLGVPLTGLAFFGVRQRRDLRVLALIGILALLLSLGRYGGLYEVFYHVVPLWSAFRAPERLMGIFAFTTAMLAGAGLDALRVGAGSPVPWLAAAIICIGAGLSLHTEAAGTWTAASFGAPLALARELTESTALAFFFSAVAALGVGIVLAGINRRKLRSGLLLAVLVVIVTLDLARANFGVYHTAPAEAATFTPPFAEALKSREGVLGPGHFRIVPLDEHRGVAPGHIRHLLGFYTAVMVARRQALDVLHNAEFHIESLKRSLPGYKAEFISMVKHQIGIQVAARFNVTYYIGLQSRLKEPQLAQGLVAALPEYELALFKNPVPPKPRAYLSLKPERTAVPVDPATLLARADFLNGEVDVIETADAALPGPAPEGLAVIEQYDPEDVRVRVDTPQPAVLVLLDAFDQGWTATLENGVELPILRANALVRAVVVPAGRHVVAFSYQTPLLKAGAWASLAGVLLCLGLLAHARRRKRHSGNAA